MCRRAVIIQKDKVVSEASSISDKVGLARGGSLTLPDAEVQVWCLPLDRPAEERAARWRLESFPAVPGYHAALAVEGKDWEFALRTGGESDGTVW